MTLDQANAALVNNRINVITKSGVVYIVYGDTLETFDTGYVYGHRVSPVNSGGPFDRTPYEGAVKWFYLANVSLVTS